MFISGSTVASANASLTSDPYACVYRARLSIFSKFIIVWFVHLMYIGWKHKASRYTLSGRLRNSIISFLFPFMQLRHIQSCFFWTLQTFLLRCVSSVIFIEQKHSDNQFAFQINPICCFFILSSSQPVCLFAFNQLLFHSLTPSPWNRSFCLA